jgi:hypothetical protein
VKAVVATIDSADLNSQFNSLIGDEVGDLQRSFDKFILSIRETLLQVAEASSAVASASSEISSSTEEMAAGAQEQTSQAGEVASAVEEMTKTIVENSKNARKTADIARKAKESAEQGGRVVLETVNEMKQIAEVVNLSAGTVKELGKSSDQIGEIISVIDDIADQTNLLALNAAIEAARAGEQGCGFAVVTDEVRRLAERTTKATKEIASMIRRIQDDTFGAVAMMEEGTIQMQGGDPVGGSGRSVAKGNRSGKPDIDGYGVAHRDGKWAAVKRERANLEKRRGHQCRDRRNGTGNSANRQCGRRSQPANRELTTVGGAVQSRRGQSSHWRPIRFCNRKEQHCSQVQWQLNIACGGERSLRSWSCREGS